MFDKVADFMYICRKLFFIVCFTGGMYFFIKNKLADANDIESHFLGLSRSQFINNIANRTGGGVFTSSMNGLGVCFNCSTLREESTPSKKNPLKRVTNIRKEITKGTLAIVDACDQCWDGNRAEEQGGGENIATTATAVILCAVDSDRCVDGDELLTLPNHTSGEVLQGISITLLDVFHEPALGQPKMRVEIKANMTDVSLSGQLSTDFDQATSLRDIRVNGPINTRFNLTLSFFPDVLNSIDIQVEIRDCMAGEVLIGDHTSCASCPSGSYSFHPSHHCRPCPENAKCVASTLTPEAGFWHSTSKSTQIHKCIVKDACNWMRRTYELEEAAMEVHKNESVLFYNNTTYKQCISVR